MPCLGRRMTQGKTRIGRELYAQKRENVWQVRIKEGRIITFVKVIDYGQS